MSIIQIICILIVTLIIIVGANNTDPNKNGKCFSFLEKVKFKLKRQSTAAHKYIYHSI